MKKPKAKRSKAQAAAARKWAAAGRAAQARTRAENIAKGRPTRTKAQSQASQRWAAAGRAAQARQRAHLPPLPKAKRALAGEPGEMYPVLGFLAEANREVPCCAATAIATHLYLTRGIIASVADVLALHLAAGGGEDGAAICDLLEVASSGFAGTRLRRFWRVDDPGLPGVVTGLRLPGGTHAALSLGPAVCVSWGRLLPAGGRAEEAWWAEWEHKTAWTAERGARGRPG